MSSPIHIVHFSNGSGGGVLSVIKNLIEFSKNPSIRNHVIFIIDKKLISDFVAPLLVDASSVRIFYFSPNWNFYYTCKQLSKLLPDDKAVIVAHDWLELGMVSNLGLQNPVVHVLHGDYSYYYQLAKKHKDSIDEFICVAGAIRDRLIETIPERAANIHYRRVPVPQGYPRKKDSGKCKIIFVGRLTEGKGYPLLPEIAIQLKEKNVNAEWHIVGEEGEGLREKTHWDKDIAVKFYGNIENDKVMLLLSEMDFIVLPSKAEGLPVTIVEAMKSGVIPLVNDIAGGIQELVIDNKTGFKIISNEVRVYAEKIVEMIENDILSNTLRMNCIKKAEELFEPYNNTKLIEDLVVQTVKINKGKVPLKIYGSRLDQKWIPNLFVSTIRKFT